jgi:signal transduction histidine kinase
MIDLWLKVAVWAWLLETALVVVIESRFSLIFYVARTMAIVSSCFVLAAFFFESLILHRRLVTTLVAREQEREGHRTSIDIVVGTLAHELRQPLASILLNERAGTILLSQGHGASGEVAEIFTEIRASVVRSNEIISSVRTMFAATAGNRGAVDVNVLLRDTVNLMRLELELHRISLQMDLSPNLPAVMGHRGQLIEVMLNALKNAIESLVEVAEERRIRIQSVSLDPRSVTINIEDSGMGLDPGLRTQVFEPFFSTKPRGMGLGLSICQSIVSNHRGTLSLLPASPRGAVFRVELPSAAAAAPSPG